MPNFTDDYYQRTKDLKPSLLLTEALTHMHSSSKRALDLGCGAGRDTRLLLQQGFEVTAIDNEPLTQKYLEPLHALGDLVYVISTFKDFDYKTYDIVNARYALPFCPPTDFAIVMQKIFQSLSPGGVFVGQFFGIDDEWNESESAMTFLTRGEVINLLSSLKIITFTERREEGVLATGKHKRWHVFDVIALKS